MSFPVPTSAAHPLLQGSGAWASCLAAARQIPAAPLSAPSFLCCPLTVLCATIRARFENMLFFAETFDVIVGGNDVLKDTSFPSVPEADFLKTTDRCLN